MIFDKNSKDSIQSNRNIVDIIKATIIFLKTKTLYSCHFPCSVALGLISYMYFRKSNNNFHVHCLLVLIEKGGKGGKRRKKTSRNSNKNRFG